MVVGLQVLQPCFPAVSTYFAWEYPPCWSSIRLSLEVLPFCRRGFRPAIVSPFFAIVQDVLNHPFLNLIYYTTCELVPSALVLYILRKLPPRRSQQGYQQIPVR